MAASERVRELQIYNENLINTARLPSNTGPFMVLPHPDMILPHLFCVRLHGRGNNPHQSKGGRGQLTELGTGFVVLEK